MRAAKPDSAASTSVMPLVAVLPVQESLDEFPDSAEYKSDPTFLGKSLSRWASIVIFPCDIEHDEYHSEAPRNQIVRGAVIAKLHERGIRTGASAGRQPSNLHIVNFGTNRSYCASSRIEH